MGGWWAQVTFRHNGTSCCAKGAVNGLQTTLQGKAGLPITVIDNWEQPYTNTTLLKPVKHCYSVFRALQGHEKVIRKAGLAIYCYSIVVSGWCTSMATKLVNKRDFNSCTYMVDFIDLVTMRVRHFKKLCTRFRNQLISMKSL